MPCRIKKTYNLSSGFPSRAGRSRLGPRWPLTPGASTGGACLTAGWSWTGATGLAATGLSASFQTGSRNCLGRSWTCKSSCCDISFDFVDLGIAAQSNSVIPQKPIVVHSARSTPARSNCSKYSQAALWRLLAQRWFTSHGLSTPSHCHQKFGCLSCPGLILSCSCHCWSWLLTCWHFSACFGFIWSLPILA